MRSRLRHVARVVARRVGFAGPEARISVAVRLQVFQWLVTVVLFAVFGIVVWGYNAFAVVTFALLFAIVMLLADPVRDARRRRQQRRSTVSDR